LKTGKWGEKQAEKLLKSKGYRVVGRRVKVGPRDEVDLIARGREVLVFVEVKTRRSQDFGRPVAAVDRRKKQFLSRAAVRYLKKLGFPEVYIRFDVIEVLGVPGSGKPDLKHIENAFPLDSRYTLP
jgi:putative endonuclease